MFPSLENLTLEELLNKQIEIKQKITQAYRSGMSMNIINQMQNMLDFISVEIQTKSQLDQEDKKRERAIEEGRDPDDNVMNIGDVE
jgi:flagellar biosynthesis chaperone FliJ